MPTASLRRTMFAVIFTVAALAAVACGSSDSASTSTPRSTLPTSAPEPTTSRLAPTAVATPDDSAAPSEVKDSEAASDSTQSALGTEISSTNFNWIVEQVGTGTKPAIAIAPDGTPNIAYMFEAREGGFVKSGTRVDGVWDITTVAEGYFYGPLDIAVGPDGVAQVAWHDHQAGSFQPNLGDIELAIKKQGGWDFVTLADDGHDGWDTRLTIDDAGVTHAVGIDPREFDGDGVEYYRLDTDGEITVEQLGSGPLTYKFALSVDVDSAGVPYVTYYDQASNDLILAIRGNDGWDLTTVDSAGDAGQFAELAIDDSDGLHISYVTQTGDRQAVVKYATKAAGASEWTIVEVDTLKDIFYGFEGAREITSIQIDSSGNPWIAYSDEANLKLAVWDGSGFTTETVSTSADRGTVFGQLVSFSLDDNDVAHITTFEVTSNGPLNGNILYFRGTAK